MSTQAKIHELFGHVTLQFSIVIKNKYLKISWFKITILPVSQSKVQSVYLCLQCLPGLSREYLKHESLRNAMEGTGTIYTPAPMHMMTYASCQLRPQLVLFSDITCSLNFPIIMRVSSVNDQGQGTECTPVQSQTWNFLYLFKHSLRSSQSQKDKMQIPALWGSDRITEKYVFYQEYH